MGLMINLKAADLAHTKTKYDQELSDHEAKKTSMCIVNTPAGPLWHVWPHPVAGGPWLDTQKEDGFSVHD